MFRTSVITFIALLSISAQAGCGMSYLANGLLGWVRPINYIQTNKGYDLILASKHLLKSYEDQSKSPFTKDDRKLINRTYKKVDHIFPTVEDMAVEISQGYENKTFCPSFTGEDGTTTHSAFTYRKIVKFLKAN